VENAAQCQSDYDTVSMGGWVQELREKEQERQCVGERKREYRE